MTVGEIYEQIQQYVIESIPIAEQKDWEKAELNLAVQPNMISFNGKYYSEEKQNPLEIRDKKKNHLLSGALKVLHKKTTGSGINKWNKAQFFVFPTAKLKVRFEWDQEWQDEEENAIKEFQKEDPRYLGPKWHWEE